MSDKSNHESENSSEGNGRRKGQGGVLDQGEEANGDESDALISNGGEEDDAEA